MKKRVSSTVTKRKANPRPRKYASASERQAAYRARAPEVCFRAEPKTVETLDRIAETLDQSRADVLLSMTKFALANHDWARFGLTHKPLPFEYGVNPVEKFTPSQLNALRREWSTIKRVDPASPTYKELVKYLNGLPQGMLEQLADARPAIPFVSGMALNRVKRKTNPMKTTRAKRKPTPAQLAARERFAEMARSGAFAKGRKRNPVKGERQFKAGDMVVTDRGEIGRVSYYRRSPDGFSDLYKLVDVQANDPYAQTFLEGGRFISGSRLKAYKGRKTNPAKVKRNPSSWGTAPLKKVRSVIARSKTTGERRTFMMADSSGVKVPTPYDFGFRLEIEGEMFDFVGRYEGPLLIISEKSTGLRLPGDVGFTLRSSYGDDKNAAKRWTLDLIERVTPQKFAQKVRAAR